MPKSNDNLQTPEWVWKPLGPFYLDPCAGPDTNIAEYNWCIDKGFDGLSLQWSGLVWCNPPFSNKPAWIERMIGHGQGILLLPERGSAPWFGPLTQAASAHFVMGKKINFIGGSSSSNIGTVLFLFGTIAIQRVYKSGLPGHMNFTDYFKPR